MYRNVRKSKQRKHDTFAQSLIWNSPKPETTKQRLLRERADAMLERDHGPNAKGFARHQIKERNKRFFASSEWFEFRTSTLRKTPHCKCGRDCTLHDVRLVMPISTHFHLRLNPANVSVKCRACREGRTLRKRERL